MPITPHESIAGHRFSYNRLRASRGRGLEPGPFESPLRARLAALPGARCPAQLTSFCPAPSKHLGKPANGSPGREAQRGGAAGPACAQGSPVRCGCARCRQAGPAAVVRTRTHTSTRAPSGKNSRYFHTQKGMKQTHKGMKNHCFSRKHVFHTLKKHFIPLCNCCIP